MELQQLRNILEAALLAAGEPRTIDQLRGLFGEDNPPEKTELREALKSLQEDYATRGIELREVASGFRIQVRESMSHWLTRLWEERPARYSRALMETLAIIAYRQPVTRGDVEEIRGVVVTSNIIRTLLERNWIKVVGHRDVPGKPAMFGTTREFLDYFGLQKLDDLPPLAELARLEPVSVQLDLGTAEQDGPANFAAALEDGVNPDQPSDEYAAAADLSILSSVSASENETSVPVARAGDDDDDFDEDDDYEDEDDDFDEDDDEDDDEDFDDDEDEDEDEEDEEDFDDDDDDDDDDEDFDDDEDDDERYSADSSKPQSGKVASLQAARVRKAGELVDPDPELDGEMAADVMPMKSS